MDQISPSCKPRLTAPLPFYVKTYDCVLYTLSQDAYEEYIVTQVSKVHGTYLYTIEPVNSNPVNINRLSESYLVPISLLIPVNVRRYTSIL